MDVNEFNNSVPCTQILPFMKSMFTLLAFVACLFAQAQTTYQGNGRTGFGGPIGTGSIAVSQTATAINFSFTKGTNQLNDVVVIYFDSRTGGFANINGINDNADGQRTAISGFNGGNPVQQSKLTFPTGFLPDFALAVSFGTTNSANLYELANGGANSLILRNPVVVTPVAGNNNPAYTFSVLRSDLALPTNNATFKFILTYTSPTAYRSDEAIGFNVTGTFPDFFNPTGPQIANINYNPYTVPGFITYNDVTLNSRISAITATPNGNQVILNWISSSELNMDRFEVQKLNGAGFEAIGSVNAYNLISGSKYTFTDASGNPSTQYRLRIIDKNGDFTYSQIVTVRKESGSVKVYPTAVRSGENIFLSAIAASTTQRSVRIVNSEGAVVYTRHNVPGTIGVTAIKLPELTRGQYYVQIVTVGGSDTHMITVL